MTDFLALKSGTDVRGVAAEGTGKEITLTDYAVERISASFVRWLSVKCGKSAKDLTVAVGHDCRVSAERIKNAVIKGFASVGCHIVDCSLSSTPSMFMITVEKEVDGSVQITASHHPFEMNGLKFFSKEGGLQGDDITDILTACEKGIEITENAADIEELDFMSEYAALLRRRICEGVGAADEASALKGFKIAVDAGNGVGGFYAKDVLAPLGADISGSVFLEPDGMFPNHIPNPENKKAMESISSAVLESKSDLGLIFDTDVDRAGCVDANGKEINRNRLIALASVIALENHPKTTVVTDSVTSTGLKKFIEGLGGKHYRYKRGYRNVINKAIELTNSGETAPLAIETSGHAAFIDNYFLDDGAYLMTETVILFAKLKRENKTFEDIIGSLEEPVESVELRLNITDKDFRRYGEGVIDTLEEFAKSRTGWTVADDNREGLRVFSKDGKGWFLLRLSVHDPVMPLNIESDVSGGCKIMANELYEFLKTQTSLVLESVENFIK